MEGKCENPCPLLPRVEALEEDSEHNKAAHKEIYGKLESSGRTVAVIEERLNQIREDTKQIKTSVRALEDKPAKRWDGMVEKFLCGIVGSLATAIVGGILFLLKMAA